MKKLFCLLFLFVSISTYSQTLKSSGIIVGIGKGGATYDLPSSVDGIPVDHANSYFKKKLALELGYRFRLQPSKSRFFYDIDLLAGYNRHEYGVEFIPNSEYVAYGGPSGKTDNYSFSIAGAASYNIIKGLSVGIGVQPIYYLRSDVFDIPVFAKVAYDLKYVELAFSYKQGLMKNYKVSLFENTRLSQWQFSLYVPLFKK